MLRYVIPLAPVTKKNSAQILRRGAGGKPFIVPSEQYRRYARDCGPFLRPAPARPIDRPVTVTYLFYLPDRRRRDLTNLQEAADDILVAYGILADDCYRIVASHDGSRCLVDRDSPRTEIWITEVHEHGEE